MNINSIENDLMSHYVWVDRRDGFFLSNNPTFRESAHMLKYNPAIDSSINVINFYDFDQYTYLWSYCAGLHLSWNPNMLSDYGRYRSLARVSM